MDERVGDLWDAAIYLILARLIWEGWLVDWKNWRSSPNVYAPPGLLVPSLLFDHCISAVEVLVYGGVLRTRYDDEIVDEILKRFPPIPEHQEWYVDSFLDKDIFHLCCSKVFELIPLQSELVRVQQHLEESPDDELEFQIIELGTRTSGRFPGSSLEVYVGFNPIDISGELAEFHSSQHSDVGDSSLPTSSDQTNESIIAHGKLLSMYTDGLSDERLKRASEVIQGNLTVNDKLFKLDPVRSVFTFPIFPRLKPYLERMFDNAEEGELYVFPKLRLNTNPGTSAKKFVEKAKQKLWTNFFNSIRARCGNRSDGPVWTS